jgi:hypothetical protein
LATASKAGVRATRPAADTSQDDAALALEKYLLRQRALRVAKKASEIAREARRIAREAAEH